MQAVILAAGESSRFWPFNGVHKSLFKIMGKPIILYTIEGLINAGITDIIIVQGPNKDVETQLTSYPEYTQNIRYVVQNDPKGMGDGLMATKELLTGQFLLILAGKINCEEIVKKLNSQINNSKNSTILVGSKTSTPALYGILKLENNRVIDIIEKPKKGDEPSDTKAAGIYVLTPAFLDVYEETKKHQYDFEDALSLYMKKYEVELMFWNDEDSMSLKYPWHLFNIRDYLFKKYLKKSVGKNTKISGSAEIIGDVFIGDNVSIMENAVIKGPCYIGNNVLVGNNAILRGGVSVEDNCAVGANMELKNSLIMDSSTTHSGFMGDSVIGRNCKIAAGFYNANVRLDREDIKVIVKGEKVDTKLKSLGSFVGDNSNIGIKVSTMPGIIVGKNVVVGASTTIMSNIPDNTRYYTKFQEIISKKNVLRQAQDFQKSIVLFDIDYTLFDTAFFKESGLSNHKVYDEVIGILEELSPFATLGIFSKGEIDFQKLKLSKTGMDKFFKENNIHIFDNKDANLISVLDKYKYSKIFLVDDKLGILYSAKKHMPKVFTVWVKRGPFALSQEEIPGFKPDADVENLSEVVRIVQSN